MRCIMFVMPVASDTHRHSHVCLFSSGGMGMENAHDSGEKASADLWEIRSTLWLVWPASNTNLSVFGSVAVMASFSWRLLSTVCGKAWKWRTPKKRKGDEGVCRCRAEHRDSDFDPRDIPWQLNTVTLLPPSSVSTLCAFHVVVEKGLAILSRGTADNRTVSIRYFTFLWKEVDKFLSRSGR